MDGWVDGWMDGWVDGWMDGWMGGWVGGWVGGWMGGWMDGWMDGWVVSDGPIHVMKYSNSIQEINWLYSLFASVIPGVSTRSFDRAKLIVYTTSLPLFIKDSNIACM